ncbi:flagellar hook-length control protein FliK [Hippea maritima]|uniref:Flagellar hook-length control protein-like C-terminal domain-containing protein n=1 Tax=Hippea maritima (strain ATCC 700847 / DSM 10411 / MH2) TaxID=760142 RepID=F2LTI3_HIPMA|nr:flagellar hook-length control protein FliK [Hippea maritima]AEA33308.1 hypothetical protein Hipma_0331 [Hippea maritima DSM 10411]
MLKVALIESITSKQTTSRQKEEKPSSNFKETLEKTLKTQTKKEGKILEKTTPKEKKSDKKDKKETEKNQEKNLSVLTATLEKTANQRNKIAKEKINKPHNTMPKLLGVEHQNRKHINTQAKTKTSIKPKHIGDKQKIQNNFKEAINQQAKNQHIEEKATTETNKVKENSKGKIVLKNKVQKKQQLSKEKYQKTKVANVKEETAKKQIKQKDGQKNQIMRENTPKIVTHSNKKEQTATFNNPKTATHIHKEGKMQKNIQVEEKTQKESKTKKSPKIATKEYKKTAIKTDKTEKLTKVSQKEKIKTPTAQKEEVLNKTQQEIKTENKPKGVKGILQHETEQPQTVINQKQTQPKAKNIQLDTENIDQIKQQKQIPDKLSTKDKTEKEIKKKLPKTEIKEKQNLTEARNDIQQKSQFNQIKKGFSNTTELENKQSQKVYVYKDVKIEQPTRVEKTTNDTTISTINIQHQSQQLQDFQTQKTIYPMDKVIEHIDKLIKMKPPFTRSLSITLNPPQLGKIELKVALDKAKSITATISVHNKDIYKTITTHIDNLKEYLTSQGLKINNIDVHNSFNENLNNQFSNSSGGFGQQNQHNAQQEFSFSQYYPFETQQEDPNFARNINIGVQKKGLDISV